MCINAKGFFLAIIYVFIFSAHAHAVSFDCAKATNKTEKAICSDNFLSYLDDTLDGVYKNALENTQNKNELIVEERAWLTKLRATCNEDNFCISTMYRGRINSLNEFIREANTQKKTQNDVKSDVKSDVKTPVKSDAKAAVNTAAKTDVKSDGENLAHGPTAIVARLAPGENWNKILLKVLGVFAACFMIAIIVYQSQFKETMDELGVPHVIQYRTFKWKKRYWFDNKSYLTKEEADQARQLVVAAKIQQQEQERIEKRAKLVAKDAEIRKFYDDKMNVMAWDSGDVKFTDEVQGANGYVDVKFEVSFSVSRPLSAMTRREIEIARYTELFNLYGVLHERDFREMWLSILYNDGKCDTNLTKQSVSRGYAEKFSLNNNADMIRHAMSTFGCSNMESGISKFLSKFAEIERKNPDALLVLEFKEKIIAGQNWFGDSDIKGSPFSTGGEDSLFIGEADSGTRLWYNQEGSLISIAPPGSGKTQCNVFPNLLSYKGPAVVLDIKGECYEKTSGWRKANVGPVYKFNPLDPSESACFNPLALIPEDPDSLFEESRLIAELLIVPSNSRDPFWENRARDVLAGIIAWLVRNNSPEDRSISKVIDVLSNIGWDDFISGAKYDVEIPALSRLGNSLAGMPEKQLESVLDTARQHLAVWEGNRVERVTSRCDWTPEDLRDGSNTTIYICIPPNELEAYAPLLRVLLAQHLRHLVRRLPVKEQKSILFMLDEMPRLGAMKPVEEALEVGRQYGIRLWMFAQSLGQLQKTYPNAEGMIGSCAVRIFMNPSAHDGTAKKLSEELGYSENIVDNSRRLMVEPTDLTGPDYRDYQIVFARNCRPAKVKKIFAYADHEFSHKLGV